MNVKKKRKAKPAPRRAGCQCPIPNHGSCVNCMERWINEPKNRKRKTKPDCPRCGRSTFDGRFCTSCGLQFKDAKPKPDLAERIIKGIEKLPCLQTMNGAWPGFIARSDAIRIVRRHTGGKP